MSEKTGSKKEQKRSSTVRRNAEREPSLTPTFAATRHNTVESEGHAGRSSESDFFPHKDLSSTDNRLTQKSRAAAEGTVVSGHDLSRLPTHTIQACQNPNTWSHVQHRVAGPTDQVKHHLQSLPEQPWAGSDFYRTEITRFQRDHSPADIQTRRQSLTPAPEGLISRDDNKTCGPSDGLNFTSEEFDATANGITDVTPLEGGVYLKVESAPFNAKGKVRVSSGSDAKAKSWDAGFIQTATSMRITGHYIGSPKHTKRTYAMPGPRRDALEKRGAPWYDPDNSDGLGPRPFTKTDQAAEVNLHDQPYLQFMWFTPDEKGKLSHIEGNMQFTAWLIARRRRGINTIFFINWATWEAGFGATLNYASTGDKSVKAKTGKTKVTAKGTGKGPGGAVLSGEIAKDSIREGGLSKWE